MAKIFPLAGLLRLRQIQQDQAASDLAVANARLTESSMRERRARASLAALDGDGEVSDTTVLYAIAAARASTGSMLGELRAVDAANRAAAEEANGVFTGARARSVGLEKLERRFLEELDSAELRTEQSTLDEIAANGWHRSAEGGAS